MTATGSTRGRRRGGFGGRRPKQAEAPDSVEEARGRAIAMLARRDHAKTAIVERLTDSGFEATAVESAVAELERERFVDDARFADSAVAARVSRGHGPIRIRLELLRAGLPAALIDAALEPRSAVWSQRAARLRVRRFGEVLPDDPRERQRQARFLLARGFTGPQVQDAMGPAGADLGLADEDGSLSEMDPAE